MMKADYEGEPVARWLNSLGLQAFVLDYRVFPYRHPTPLLDAQRAIRYLRHHAGDFNLDPGRIGILGFSAGGHLAATVATHFDRGDPQAGDPVNQHSCRPDALILCYPVITFGEFCHGGSRAALLGENPLPELLASLSNETQITAGTPPTFLWHSTNDQVVPVENSLLFAAGLRRHNVPFDLHIFNDGDHGGSLAEDNPILAPWTTLCQNWLQGIGFI